MARTDWLPATQEGKLAMARDWLAYVEPRLTLWGIPQAAFDALENLTQDAAQTLAVIENESTRTRVTEEQCRTAFRELTAHMRLVKKRYVLSPPLVPADFLALGLKIPDTQPTKRPVPGERPETEAAPSGKGIHTVTAINPLTQNKHRPGDAAGVAFASRVRGSGDPVSRAEDMPSEYQTVTVKEYAYTEGDYGKTADYATAYENAAGKRGPWSNVTSLLISG